MSEDDKTDAGDGSEGAEARETAAEYVLGVLSAQEHLDFEAQMRASPTLRADVVRWQEHFAALGMDVEEVAPPKSVFAHLKRELWGENKLPWRRRIRIWEFALGGVAAALVAFFVLTNTDLAENTTPVLHAQIENSETALQVALALSEGTDLLRIEFAGPAPATGRSYELWAIAEGAAPVSLGLLPTQRVSALRLDADTLALVVAGVTLALSDEPEGGSPTGGPTGAVLGAGVVQVLSDQHS